MPDWTKSMQQTFEYYTVDPTSWKDNKRLDIVTSSTIERDGSAETLGSASISITELIEECYIRIYLVTIQNGVRERHALGTFLTQTPSSSFNGKTREITMDAYTPLLELKENPPPIGYYVPKKDNIMKAAYNIASVQMRAPISEVECDEKLIYNFVANTDDTWLTFLYDLIANARYTFSIDELGQVLFAPRQDVASLQPVWTFNDDNSSILYPDLDIDHDLYGIPNVVEVIYSTETEYHHYRLVNDDPNSPISTVNRGREIIHRVTDPDLNGQLVESTTIYYIVEYDEDLGVYVNTYKTVWPSSSAEPVNNAVTAAGDEVYVFNKTVDIGGGASKVVPVYFIISEESFQLKNYAIELLRALSSVEYTVTFSHAYCPVRLGDCVRLNYERAGLDDVKAQIISQSIQCKTGCQVTSKAVYTKNLWR